MLHGIHTISTPVQVLCYGADGKLALRDARLTLIPYYAWAHRGEGDMDVWIPWEVGAASALPLEAQDGQSNAFFH